MLWTSERFMYRNLSGMLVAGPTLVFGDGDGYVHFLDAADGQTLLRLTTDGTPVIAAPVASGNTVLVVTRDGGVFAFRPN
ncbi:MAG: PQQ-binding-like beta-propeller repeat protein [Rubrivivax sp.]